MSAPASSSPPPSSSSFYVAEGEAFRATSLTRGPWSPLHQHGGPPAGLLARAIEASFDRASMRVARIAVQIFRPLPFDVFRVAVETVREGKKVRSLRARLVDVSGRDVALADALVLRRAVLAPAPAPVGARAKPAVATAVTPRPPESCEPYEFTFFGAAEGYHTAMETRHVAGTWGDGAMSVWMRMRVPLVGDEEPSPLVRALVAADSGNGVSAALDVADYTFVNAELTVSFAREPIAEWILLDAATRIADDDGIGLADAALSDVRGPFGRGLQSLVVERRRA